MNAIGPRWWCVNIGSANEGTKPSPETVLTKIPTPYGVTKPQWLR